jgi:hypothetical protein
MGHLMAKADISLHIGGIEQPSREVVQGLYRRLREENPDAWLEVTEPGPIAYSGGPPSVTIDLSCAVCKSRSQFTVSAYRIESVTCPECDSTFELGVHRMGL